jgi:hypothetical protein
MKYSIVTNIPQNPLTLYTEALSKSFYHRIDEKGTVDNPNQWRRSPSKLSFGEAFKIVQENNPHWVISYRNMSCLSGEPDYWEFGGCNISSNEYGEVFIWIHLSIETALELFNKYNLTTKDY